MNKEKAEAIRDKYFALSRDDRAFVSARVIGTNMARMYFFEVKTPTDPEEYARILVASWFFTDLEAAITREELEATTQ